MLVRVKVQKSLVQGKPGMLVSVQVQKEMRAELVHSASCDCYMFEAEHFI